MEMTPQGLMKVYNLLSNRLGRLDGKKNSRMKQSNGTPDSRKERGMQFSLLESWLYSCSKAKKAFNKET